MTRRWQMYLVMSFAVVVAMPACNDETGPSEFSDPAVPIRVTRGETFVILLESNASTGYSWRLGEPLDEFIVSLRDSRYETGGSGLPGAAGTELWTFDAVGRGETTIALEYARPWEEGPPANTASFQLIVS